MRQLNFIPQNLESDSIVNHSPSWLHDIDSGNIGTSHTDIYLMTPDLGLVVIYPYALISD